MTLDPNKIFRRITDGDREYDQISTEIYDSAGLPAGTTGKFSLEFNFSGHPGTIDTSLYELPESEIFAIALEIPRFQSLILAWLGLIPGQAWCLLEAPREALVSTRPGKPGDFDLIAGPIMGGKMCFDYVVETEVKIRKVDRFGRPHSTASGTGTTQALGASHLGFDRTLLLHLLVQEETPLPHDYAISWIGMVNSDFYHSMRASVGMLARVEPATEAPYGFALLGLGQIPGTDPRRSGTLCPIHLRAPPLRPLWACEEVRTTRNGMESNLVSLIGRRRPPSRFLRICSKCGRVFTPRPPLKRRCCA